MLLLKDGSDSINLEGFTAIVPSIGVGNAGQLACDLIISTLQLKRIGNIWHPALIPIAGPSAFQHDSQNKAASCEVYIDESKKLLAIQLRSPLISKHLDDFHTNLVNLFQKCSRVIILTSSFGYEKHTIEASPFEYIANNVFKQNHADRLGELKWTEFSGEVVHGGGNAVKLYKALDASNVPALLLFKYVLEGDNSMDASQLVKQLDELMEQELKISTVNGLKLTVPVSWKLLYGNEVGDLIF
ncbi:proteasome assembly chaperone 2 [Episyrphus balteatus]|uniref:proteasome assembly chaperone 2 n=1 Tax=Episyrphus balteatus TaxID=286459 RepID=UPI002485742A|nr:proteasome assembly chaperone 2 [Episyrphus balteatus]